MCAHKTMVYLPRNMKCNRDCFNCTYKDCIVNDMSLSEYKDSNLREKEIFKEVYGKSKPLDKSYVSARNIAYQKEHGRKKQDRHQYNQKYYKEHAEEIKAKRKENYDTKKNTEKCRKYNKKNESKRKEYWRKYYLKNIEKKKANASIRYHRIKAEKDGVSDG